MALIYTLHSVLSAQVASALSPPFKVIFGRPSRESYMAASGLKGQCSFTGFGGPSGQALTYSPQGSRGLLQTSFYKKSCSHSPRETAHFHTSISVNIKHRTYCQYLEDFNPFTATSPTRRDRFENLLTHFTNQA